MRFHESAMLVLGGMGCGLILSVWGGIYLWGGFAVALVVLSLVKAWRGHAD